MKTDTEKCYTHTVPADIMEHSWKYRKKKNQLADTYECQAMYPSFTPSQN